MHVCVRVRVCVTVVSAHRFVQSCVTIGGRKAAKMLLPVLNWKDFSLEGAGRVATVLHKRLFWERFS